MYHLSAAHPGMLYQSQAIWADARIAAVRAHHLAELHTPCNVVSEPEAILRIRCTTCQLRTLVCYTSPKQSGLMRA